MKKFIGLLIQGMVLGLVIGLCLASLAALFYKRLKGAPTGYFTSYFLAVGGLMGCVAGWCFSLQLILAKLLDSLVQSVARLVPLTGRVVGPEWAGKIDKFLNEVLSPMPSLLRKGVEFFMAARFARFERVNRVLQRAGKKHPAHSENPEWLATVALEYFLEPVWAVFWGAYVILLLTAVFLWSLPFIR